MSYTPRLTSEGMLNNFHWYSGNPFYRAGYGLPNCTCYAFGRFWEIGDPNSDHSNYPNLSKESIMNIINCLCETTETLTLTLGSTNMAKLTEAEIAIATNKGWTVA